LLSPFSALYAFITLLRNLLFDLKLLESTEFDLPIINVGNLSTGGTGKTPVVEYLIEGFNNWDKNVVSFMSVGGIIPFGVSHRIINTQKLRINMDAGVNYTYAFVQYDDSKYDIFKDILYTDNRHHFSVFAGFKFGVSFFGAFDFFIGPQIDLLVETDDSLIQKNLEALF